MFVYRSFGGLHFDAILLDWKILCAVLKSASTSSIDPTYLTCPPRRLMSNSMTIDDSDIECLLC